MRSRETATGKLPAGAAYFDSALVAKFYLNEPGREAIRDLAGRAGIVATSGIAVAEIAAAFHRKFREGEVKRDVFEALNGQFEHDLKTGLWLLHWPSEDLLLQTRALYAKLDKGTFLRSLDALHLVTARAGRYACLYTNDRHLLAACARVGMRATNPLAPA